MFAGTVVSEWEKEKLAAVAGDLRSHFPREVSTFEIVRAVWNAAALVPASYGASRLAYRVEADLEVTEGAKAWHTTPRDPGTPAV